MPKDTELFQIARDSIVLVVTLNDPFQPFTDLRYWLVHPADQFCFQTEFGKHAERVRKQRGEGKWLHLALLEQHELFEQEVVLGSE